MKKTFVCETCQEKYFSPGEPGAGDGGTQGSRDPRGGTLTGTSEQGIIDEDAPSHAAFSSLCPRCREEAWEAETHSQPAYPYKH